MCCVFVRIPVRDALASRASALVGLLLLLLYLPSGDGVDPAITTGTSTLCWNHSEARALTVKPALPSASTARAMKATECSSLVILPLLFFPCTLFICVCVCVSLSLSVCLSVCLSLPRPHFPPRLPSPSGPGFCLALRPLLPSCHTSRLARSTAPASVLCRSLRLAWLWARLSCSSPCFTRQRYRDAASAGTSTAWTFSRTFVPTMGRRPPSRFTLTFREIQDSTRKSTQ